jgi:hypothetical protein
MDRETYLDTVRLKTIAPQLMCPGLHARLLLLHQTDDLLAVMPNMHDTDGLSDAKFIPQRVTWALPVNGKVPSSTDEL